MSSRRGSSTSEVASSQVKVECNGGLNKVWCGCVSIGVQVNSLKEVKVVVRQCSVSQFSRSRWSRRGSQEGTVKKVKKVVT